MALNSIFDKFKEGTAAVGGAALDKIKMNTNKKETSRTLKTIRKELSESKMEFSKLMNVIGRETFELFQKKELSFDAIEEYLNKASGINDKINELINERDLIEKANQKYHICECGEKLDKSVKFCPQCGMKFDDGTITCSCGQIHDITEKFCSNCGDNIQEIYKSNTSLHKNPTLETCVCGAVFPEGQKFCMECGRLKEEI